MEDFYWVSLVFLFGRTRMGKLLFIILFISVMFVKNMNG